MTWSEILTLVTLGWTIVWAIYSNHRDKQTNIKLEQLRKSNEAHNLLRQTKYELEFKAYQELTYDFAVLVGATGGFVLYYENYLKNDRQGYSIEKISESCNEAMRICHDFANKVIGYAPFIDKEIAQEFYTLRGYCVKCHKLFVHLEASNFSSKQQAEEFAEASEIIKYLSAEHGKINDKLRYLINKRIAEVKEN